MSQPAKKDSAGYKGNSNWTDRDPSSQEATAKAKRDASSESTSDAASDASLPPRYGDRNPNWTDRELPAQKSQPPKSPTEGSD
ncbi:MAG: hypothetical protein AAF609_25060 [Cyanobacteria bacterium P01_C01_bin.120]